MPIPQQRDPETTRKQLTEWMAAKLPAADGLELSELSGPTSTGFSNDTLLFDATWTEGDVAHADGFVARVRPSGYQIFPEVDVALQYHVMKILGEQTDVPVPRMWWLEEDESVLGAPFYVMSKVDGRIPTDNPPYTIEGWVHDAAPEQQERLWWTGIDTMARVHRLDWRALGFDFLDRPELGRPGLDQQLAYYDEYFAWACAASRSRSPRPRSTGSRPTGPPTRSRWGCAGVTPGSAIRSFATSSALRCSTGRW